MIFFLASAGYALQNRLTISSNSSSAIRVLIDGRTYQLDKNRNDREILLSDLQPGNRNIKIYGQKNSGRNAYGNINNERNMQLLYNGNLYIRDGVDVDVSINRFGKVFVDEQVMTRAYEYSDRYDNGNNGRYDNSNSGRYDNGNNDRYDNRDRDRNLQSMSDRTFLQLKQTMARESMEESRLNLAKTMIINYNVSSSQVRELMAQFNFEPNKLEIAKYCYRFATDKQYYYSVADGLSYSNSKNELLRFIQQQK
jgi:hypothetical protein